MSLPAVTQVVTLFFTWWYRVNWLFLYPTNLFGNELNKQFSSNVLTSLRDMPVGESMAFETYLERFIDPLIGLKSQDENDYTWIGLQYAIEQMVIKPLEGFGVLLTRYEKEMRFLYPNEKLASFSVTDFGHALLAII